MKSKLDVYTEHGSHTFICDHWRIQETGQLIIEQENGEIAYKTIFAAGKWIYIAEHPA